MCATQKIWRPFCTSLRRQDSGAPQFTVKMIHQQPRSNEITYRFFLFFHPSWHLWHCPVDRGIFVQVWQILAAENGQGLTSIQRPRPKRQFTHFFYNKRHSINLFDLLRLTAGLLRVLMEESVEVSQSAGRLRSVAARTEPGRPGSRSLSIGLFRSYVPLFLPGSIRHGQHGGHFKLMQLTARSERPSPFDHTNSHSHAGSHACALAKPLGCEERREGS